VREDEKSARPSAQGNQMLGHGPLPEASPPSHPPWWLGAGPMPLGSSPGRLAYVIHGALDPGFGVGARRTYVAPDLRALGDLWGRRLDLRFVQGRGLGGRSPLTLLRSWATHDHRFTVLREIGTGIARHTARGPNVGAAPTGRPPPARVRRPPGPRRPWRTQPGLVWTPAHEQPRTHPTRGTPQFCAIPVSARLGTPTRRYGPQPCEPAGEPTFSFEVSVVTGVEGAEVRTAQAQAIKELLAWLVTIRHGLPAHE